MHSKKVLLAVLGGQVQHQWLFTLGLEGTQSTEEARLYTTLPVAMSKHVLSMLIVLSALITGKLGACRLCKNPVAFRSTVQSMLVNTFTHFFHHNDKVVEDVYVKSNSGKCSIAFIFHFLVLGIRKIQQRRWFVTFTRYLLPAPSLLSISFISISYMKSDCDLSVWQGI